MSYTRFIKTALVRAAEAALAEIGTLDVRVKEGQVGNFLTRADTASERTILSMIASELPGCRVLPEEGASDVNQENFDEQELVAIIDPIDGTANFSLGLPMWAISIGLWRYGVCVGAGVYDPTPAEGTSQPKFWILDERGRLTCNDKPVIRMPTLTIARSITGTNWAFGETPRDTVRVLERLVNKTTVRAMGSAVMDCVMTATGAYGYYIHSGMKPFDLGAGLPIMRAMGVCITDWNAREATIWSDRVIAAPPDTFMEFYKLTLG